jgi:uncharacterized hydrophobic protein (TIGR00271 family)
MTRTTDHRGALDRLRDLSGGFHRPEHADYAHLLTDDGRFARDERLKIMARLLPPQNRLLAVRYLLMLTLSVTIAVMGLAANSVAVVIGAMLIAPMMTPIMTFTAAVGLGLGRRAAQAVFLVLLGAAWAVVFAVLLAKLLPEVTIGSEILSRARPDVRDLIVAVAAGAAGAYATAREDMSGALPGVAVAVALVPPLAATGILVADDQMVLARGSSLLFLTNLLAIVVSALVVLLATGVIPSFRLCFHSSRIAMTTTGIAIATVLIAVPLTTTSLDAAESSRQRSEISATIDDWVGSLNLEVGKLDVAGSTVTVELTGLDEPPAAFALATQLVPILGEKAEAVVRWDQRAQGVARADAPPVADPVVVARDVIEVWIAGLRARGMSFDLLDISMVDDRIDVELGGPIAPPPSPSLPDDVAGAIGRPIDLTIRWIQQIDPGLTEEPPVVRLERYVLAWIGPRTSVRLIAASFDAGTVTIDLGADGTPLGLGVLRRLADDAVGGATNIEVRTLPLTVISQADEVVSLPDLD